MFMNLDAVPWNAAVGGLMIGAAVTLLLLFNGCVAGVSGSWVDYIACRKAISVGVLLLFLDLFYQWLSGSFFWFARDSY